MSYTIIICHVSSEDFTTVLSSLVTSLNIAHNYSVHPKAPCGRPALRAIMPGFRAGLGVNQGYVLCPNLFKININDLALKLSNEGCPLKLSSTNVPCLLYADETIWSSYRSATGLQDYVNQLHSYCNEWGLTVNDKKTTVIYFNSQKKHPTQAEHTIRGVGGGGGTCTMLRIYIPSNHI